MKKLSGSLLLAFIAGCLFAASPVTIIENGPDPRRKTLLTVLTMPDGHLVIETNRYIYGVAAK